VKFTKSSRVSVPWLLLAKDPEEYINSNCYPEGFLIQDPSKLTKINIDKLWHHWDEREKKKKKLYYGSSRLRPKICQTPPRTSLGTVGIREFMLMLTVPQTTAVMMMNRTRKVTTVHHALLIVPSAHPGLRAAGLCTLSQGLPSRLGKVNPGAQQLRGAISLCFSVVFSRIHTCGTHGEDVLPANPGRYHFLMHCIPD